MTLLRKVGVAALLWSGVVGIAVAQAPATSGTTGPTGAAIAPGIEQNENLKKAVDRFRQNDVEGALKELEAAVVTQPDLAPPRVMLANLFFNTNNVAAGRNLLERAVIDQPDHPDVYRAFGELAIAEGRTTDAALAFEKSLSLASGERWPVKLLRPCRQWLGLASVAERATVEPSVRPVVRLAQN